MAKIELRELLLRARTKKGWGIDKVSREALVSNNSLLLIEKGEWPGKQKRLLAQGTGKGRHTLQSWINIIVCSALVLDEEPLVWLQAAGLPDQDVDRFIAEFLARRNKVQKFSASDFPLITKGQLLPDYELTLQDLDLLKDVVQNVGGSVPLKTALDLLACRKKNAQTSE